MNNTIQYLFFAYFLMSTSTIYAQSTSPFDEYEYTSQGVLYLNDGEPIAGKLQYSIFFNHVYLLDVDGEAQKFKSKHLKGFVLDTLGGMKFDVKQGGIYQNITPRGGQEIKMYKCFVSDRPVTYAIQNEIQGQWEYYLDFPDKKNVLSINDLRISVHKTLPRYLGDCPELAKKVSERQEGYKYEGNPFKVGKIMKQAVANSEKDAPENPKAGLYLKILKEYYDCE